MWGLIVAFCMFLVGLYGFRWIRGRRAGRSQGNKRRWFEVMGVEDEYHPGSVDWGKIFAEWILGGIFGTLVLGMFAMMLLSIIIAYGRTIFN